MTWQYRVMRKRWQLGRHWGYRYGIYEIYSQMIGSNRPGWAEDACQPSGDIPGDLKSDYDLMAEAFKLPVLDHKTGKPIKKEKEEK